jgi:hypothetical protein
LFSIAFEECAAIICIAKENGSLMLQIGQRLESETDGGSFILGESINPTPGLGNAIWLPMYIGVAFHQETEMPKAESISNG